MATATFTLFDEFIRYLGDGTIDLDSDTFKWILTNTAPVAATDTLLADISQISGSNGYTTDGDAATSVTWAETGAGTGIWQFSTADQTWTAVGGVLGGGSFRYVVLYDATPIIPLGPLVGYLDHVTSISLNPDTSFTVDVGSAGLIQVQEA